jgi:hypothetical protein
LQEAFHAGNDEWQRTSDKGRVTKDEGMVSTIQCPNPKCRKFMLVEESERGKVVTCLLCKEPIPVTAKPAPTPKERSAPA